MALRRGLRRGVYALGALALVIVAIMGLFPVAVKGYLSSFTVAAAKSEKRARIKQGEETGERLTAVVAELARTVQRARRLAWATGLPSDLWRQAVPDPPKGELDEEAVETWVQLATSRLDAVEPLLNPARVAPPCSLMALPLARPLAPERAVPVGQFGWRVSPFTGKQMANHGVTLASQLGEPVLAPGLATVYYAGEPRERMANEWSRFGVVVVLDHGGGVLTVFGHLKEALVKRGQTVTRGQRIGSVGQTGWTRVPALYYEVRWPLAGLSKPVDPALVTSGLPVEDLESRLRDPVGGLPDDYSLVEHLRGGEVVKPRRPVGS